MRYIDLYIYYTIRYIVLFTLLIVILLGFIVEKPVFLLKLASKPLSEYGIKYKSIKGGLISGFKLRGFNYQDKITANSAELRVDWNSLKDRKLIIDNLTLNRVHIKKEYLKSLIESNSSNDDNNSSLPLKKIIIKKAHLDIENIIYNNYKINSANLDIKNFKTDIKSQYRGDIKLKLDSNITNLNLTTNITKDNNFKLKGDIEPKRKFLEPLLKEQNITLKRVPKFYIDINKDLKILKYHISINRLGLKYLNYIVDSKKLIFKGNYNIEKKDLNVDINTILNSNLAKLKLKGSANLNLNDINNSLKFRVKSNIKTLNLSIIKPYNINGDINLNASGDMKRVKYTLLTNTLKIRDKKYRVDSKRLIVNGSYNITRKDINIKNIDTILNSNLANLKLKGSSRFNLDDINNSLKFRVKSNIKTHNLSIIEPYNISGDINLNASGDMKRLKYALLTNSLKIRDKKYRVESQRLIVNGSYSVVKKDIDIKKIDTIIYSNIANLKLKGSSSLNLNDINSSLKFNINSNIRPKEEFIEEYIKDKNITIKKSPDINLKANGTLKETNFQINLNDLRVKKEDIDLKLSSITLNGDTKPINGDTKVDIKSRFISNIADGVIKDRLKLNFKDINQTLNSKGDANLLFKSKYINRVLRDKNITDITISNNPKLYIKIDGNLKKLTLTLNSKIDILKYKISSHLKLNSSPIKLDIINHRVDGAINIINISKNMGFSIKSRFNGDYTNPKFMNSSSRVYIKNFNGFGVNLNPLTPINLTIKSNKSGAFAKLDSKRVKLNITTRDYDNIRFILNTKKLYIYKIVKLPDELHHKFIELHLKGDMKISKKYFNINGDIYSNKKFKAKISAKNSSKGLNTYINIPHLKLNADGDIDKKNIKLDIETDSILELEKEIQKLYPFDIVKVDGALTIKSKLKGEKVWLNINSPKIEFNGFNIENIDIDGDYKDNLITLNRVNLKTTGFEDEKFNKEIHLNRKAKIYLGEKRDILIDMLPNILIIAKGDKKYLRGKLFIKNLPIGHPDYGTMFLNTNINYKQNDDKKRVTGDIYLKKMRLFYEAKFLDIAYDPDVLVVTKKSKKIKKRLNNNEFLNNTYININLKAPKAKYKTPDIDLDFNINLNINKSFGEPISLIGRVEDINGHYDQVPKRFKIVNSTVLFKGGEKINPLLDIRVEYELPQVMIYIDIGGDASRPKIEFSSEPPMPKKDIMSYLLLGVSTAKLSNGEGSLGREAELFILNQAARDFAYDFNLDRLFIKDDGTGDGYIIEAGKKITKHNMVIIESSKEGNSYILEHEFDKSVKLRVGQHQKEHPSESIDIFYRKRFK